MMSPFTQEVVANRHNPFDIYPKSNSPQSGHPLGRAAASVGTTKRRFKYEPAPLLDKLPPTEEDWKRAKQRAIRQQILIKQRQAMFQTAVRRAFKVVAVVFFVFMLLPSSVQRTVYGMLPFVSHAPQVTESPLPLAYDYISSPFGKRWGRMHQGIDFAAAVGAPIYASTAGTVIHSGWEPGYGKSILLDHGNGLHTLYAHCSKLLVKVGAVIPKGGLIARVGSTGHSTGPHLHFEVIVNGVRKNPAWYYSFNTPSETHLASAE